MATDNLARANARRHQSALAAAHVAIERLVREGRAVNFGAVARAAGVSRAWLYRQGEISETITRLRCSSSSTSAFAARRASTDSLRQRLDTARDEITRLRAENSALRDQLARHLGLRRADHGSYASGGPS